MPKRGRSAVGHSDKLIAEQYRLVACSSDTEPATVLAQGSKDARAFGSLHPNYIDSSLLDLSQDVLNAQNAHSSSVSPSYRDAEQRQKLASQECTSVLLRLFSGDQNKPPFGSEPSLPRPPWSRTPAPSPLTDKGLLVQDTASNSPSSSAHSTPQRKVLQPSNVDNQVVNTGLQSQLCNQARSLLVPASASGQHAVREPCQPLHSPASQLHACTHSTSPRHSFISHASPHHHEQQPGSDADVSGLFSDQSLPMHGMGSPIRSTSTAVIPMPSWVGSVSSHSPTPCHLQSPTPRHLQPFHLKGTDSFHRQLHLMGAPSSGSLTPYHSPQRAALTSSASSTVEPFSACVHTALFGDNRVHKSSQQTFSPGCEHADIRRAARAAAFQASSSPTQSQSGPQSPNRGPSDASNPPAHHSRAPAASTSSSATSVDSAKQPPAKEPACFGPQSACISFSPQLAYAAIVLLAASGVMGLAHSSAFILILLDGRAPDGTVLSSLLLVSPLSPIALAMCDVATAGVLSVLLQQCH